METRERESDGFIVVTDPAAQKAERKAKGAVTKERRERRSAARTASQRGMSTWRPRAKRIAKAARHVQREHPELPAHTAKDIARCAVHVTDTADRLGY